MQNQESILKTSIDELNADYQFKSGAILMGFKNIEEILALSINELKKKEGFNYRWLESYLSFLEKYNLLGRV